MRYTAVNMGSGIAYISQLVLILISSRVSSATIQVPGQNEASPPPEPCTSVCRHAADPRACLAVCRGLSGDIDGDAVELRRTIISKGSQLPSAPDMKMPSPPEEAQLPDGTWLVDDGDLDRSEAVETEGLVKRFGAGPRMRRPRGRAYPCARVCQRVVYLSHGSCLRCVFKYTNLMKI